MSNNKSKSKSSVRSLICDGNGIIVAEMVYRCMICGKIHDVVDDAERHYTHEHINGNDNDDDVPQDGHGSLNSHDNHSHNSSMRNNNMPSLVSHQQHQQQNTMNSNHNVVPIKYESHSSSYQSHNDNLELSDEEEDLLCDGEDMPATLPDGTPIFDDVPSPIMSSNNHEVMANSMMDINMSHKGMSKAISYASPSNTHIMPVSSSSAKSPAAKKLGGGYVTCEVCELTKFYSHISRRYGVFSCESCAKFFYRYLLKPTKFTCPNNGICSLKIDIPGGRCKSCLLQACLRKYIIDPKKHPNIFQKKETHCTGEDAVNAPVPAHSSITPTIIKIKQHLPSQASKQAQNTFAKSQIDLQVSTSSQSSQPNGMNRSISDKSNTANSGLKRKQPQQQDSSDGSMMFVKTRRGGCRECPGCMSEDCGECLYCLDKPKFGGNDVKKQRCVRRRCHNVT